MTDETETDDLSVELRAEFDEVTKGISDGVQLILDTLDYNVEYVLSIRSQENDLMGLITNTEEDDALEIVMSAGQNLHDSISEKQTVAVAPKIVLPH